MQTLSIKGRICYKVMCPVCSIDMDFRRKSDLHKPCRSCANSISKKGKPSPMKGRKTGKPAWNTKNIDPIHKLLRNRVSRRLRHALTDRGLSKKWQETFLLLGFNVETLKTHLESKFEPGMNWSNVGEWHIDHKIPDSWFKYSSVEDDSFKNSWKLENLQPMWKAENISKNNRYSGSYQRKVG